MKDFCNDEDRAKSLDKEKENSGSKFLKNPETEAPIYFLQSAYEYGYVHYVTLPDGKREVVACGGGEEGKGFAPEKCPLCALTLAMYQEAKAMSAKKEGAGDKIKGLANKLRGSFSARFIAAMGEMLTIKENGVKVKVPDFDDAKVGILPVSQATYDAFCALATNGKLAYIKSGKDLMNRVNIISKVKKANSTYAGFEIIPQETVSEAPQVVWDASEYNLSEAFVIDMVKLQGIYAALTNTKVVEKEVVAYEDEDELFDEEDDEVEEDSSEEDDDLDDSFLDEDGEVDLVGVDTVKKAKDVVKTKKSERADF